MTSYWRLPERLYDAPDELAQWARQALAVARTNKAREKPAKKSAKKPGKKLGKKLGKRKAGRKARL